MQHLVPYIILFLLFFFTKILFRNLESKFYKSHQKLAGKETIPLLGGIVMFCFYSFYFSFNDLNFLIFSFLILVLGIFSDNNFLQSPKIRLLLQTLILSFFVYLSEVQINDLRNDYLNDLISNNYFGLFFTIFCLLVLINGSNFIDGLDGLNLGYFFLIILIVVYIESSLTLSIDKNQIFIIFYFISFLLILNILNYLYLGDSGSYLIGFIFGSFLIQLNNENYFLSPYFIALLLWYPAFENLFSIIRKRIIKQDPLLPDNFHFHQLLFFYLKKRDNFTIKRFSNIIASILIIIYNLIVFLIGSNFVNHTKILLFIILINIIVYLTSYFLLKKISNY